MKSFLSLLPERREMRASEKCHPGLGVGSNPSPIAPELCMLPCAPLHIHNLKYFLLSDPVSRSKLLSLLKTFNFL